MNTKPIITTARRCLLAALLPLLAFASGCKNFFSDPNTTTGTTTTNTGDYAYVVSNYASATAPVYALSGFTIGTGTLTAISGLPVTLPFAPVTAVVNPANSILYVAGSQVVYGYTIGSTGALTAIESATDSPALANANIVSMVISPDGQWLLALDSNPTTVTIDEFQIASTGLLTLETGAAYTLLNSTATIVPRSIAVAPTGDYVAVSLGTGGDVLFGFTTSTGALTALTQVNVPATTSADQALTFDSAGATLYIARSGTGSGVVPYTIGSAGALTAVAGAPFAAGSGPASIVIDKTGGYLYVGNQTDSTISAFTIGTGGVLTAITGSPFASGIGVDALAVDNSGKYLLATALGGTPDLDMYSFSTTVGGALTVSTNATTGDTSEPSGATAIALTH
jgi:6-phosphogluconolactonase (cycloisomerase 2 family)